MQPYFAVAPWQSTVCWWWAGQLSVGWALSQMMSLTLTVLRKSPHPSLGTFTDVIDPRWSAPNFVSLWQEHNHADTLGFTHMLAMQGQTPEGNLRRMCYYIAHTHRLRIQGTYTHCCISLCFRDLISHLLMWRGCWSVAHPGEAHYVSHLSAQGRPEVLLLLKLVGGN